MIGRSPMLSRVLLRTLMVRRGRTLTALLALTVATAVATAMLNLIIDIESKLTREFRKIGANVLVTAQEGSALNHGDIGRLRAELAQGDIVAPIAYAVAKTRSGRPIVVAGIDMAATRRMNPWWDVPSWPDEQAGILIGERAAAALKLEDDASELVFKGRSYKLDSPKTFRTGSVEESRIYLPLARFIEWTGVGPSVVEVSIQGTAEQIAAALSRLQGTNPSLEVRPIRQVAEAEARILDKTQAVLLASAIVIILIVALSVLATLTASVLERRKDFAVMKALGSSKKMVSGIFLAEAMAIAVVASFVGFAIGSGIAALIGRINFHAAVVPRLDIFPPVMLGTMVLALISAAVPLARLQKIEPAVMLKGD